MKKIMSLILSIVIVCSCFGCLAISSVSATSPVIENALSWALSIANDETHKYILGASHGAESQHYDCSSFVSWALKHAGIDVPVSTTYVMRANFKQYGFEWIPWSSIGSTANLQRGDILLDESQHVEFYYGNNQILGAHNPSTGISLSSYYNNVGGVSWDGILRYEVEPNSDDYIDIGDKFYAVIKNTEYNNYLSIANNTDNVYLQDKNGTSKQLWFFERQDDNSYIISSCYDGNVLEMTNGERKNATHITAHDSFWGGYYQQWYLISSGNGYRLLSKHYTSEHWYLDRSNNVDNNGNKVQIFEKACDEDQVWTIDKESIFSDLGDKFYSVISNSKNGRFVSKVNGTDNIYLQDKNNTSKQVWFFERQDDGAYAISSCYDGKYLEMSSGIRENRIQVSAPNDFWGGYYQQWYLIPYGNGFKMLNKHFTSEGWYLDRSVNGDDNGNYVQIYEKFWNADDQVWTIDKSSAIANLGNNFYSVISNTKNGGFVSKVNGTDNIYLQDKNNTSKQVWFFERQDDGAYTISSCYDGKYLEMSSGIRENRIQVSAPNGFWGGYYQQWYLIPYGNGFKMLNKHFTSEGWYLDRSVNGDNNGNYVQIYEKFWNADDQVWSIEKREPYSIGDTDLDGRININDVTATQRHLAGIEQFNEEQLLVADVNGDGEIDISDATHLQMYLVGFDLKIGV